MKLAVAVLLCALVGIAVANGWGNDRGRGNGPYGGGNGGGHRSSSSSGSHGHSHSHGSSEESKEEKACKEQFTCTKDPKYSLPTDGTSIARDCSFAVKDADVTKNRDGCNICCDGWGLSQGIPTDKTHGSVEGTTTKSCICCQLACRRRFPGFPGFPGGK